MRAVAVLVFYEQLRQKCGHQWREFLVSARFVMGAAPMMQCAFDFNPAIGRVFEQVP